MLDLSGYRLGQYDAFPKGYYVPGHGPDTINLQAHRVFSLAEPNSVFYAHVPTPDGAEIFVVLSSG
ncbi:MAG: hypothetical protein M3294_03550 [Pseudomonadota bacterium]|nr:hypothetical protein [Pseudomonadota bacterium]